VDKSAERSAYNPELKAEQMCTVEALSLSICVPAVLYSYTNLSVAKERTEGVWEQGDRERQTN
jgi:hypothetical protein